MIIPTGYAQVNLRFTGNGYPRGAEVTYGVDNTGSTLTAEAIAGEALAAWVTWIKGAQSIACVLKEVYVKLGPNATGADFTLSSGVSGDLADNCLPCQVAVLARKLTASGGRINKGRWFWPGATEDQTDGAGLLNTGGLDDWSGAVAGFWAAHGTADLPVVLLHSDAGDTPTPVTNVQTQQQMASQRRRLRKVGGRRTTP